MTRHAAINARTARAFSIRRISSIRGPRSVVRRILKIRDSKYLFLKQTAFDARLRSWIEGQASGMAKHGHVDCIEMVGLALRAISVLATVPRTMRCEVRLMRYAKAAKR